LADRRRDRPPEWGPDSSIRVGSGTRRANSTAGGLDDRAT